jgi:hypothetical protein
MSLKNNDYFYRVIADLKNKGVLSVSKEEFDRIREDALREVELIKQKKENDY